MSELSAKGKILLIFMVTHQKGVTTHQIADHCRFPISSVGGILRGLLRRHYVVYNHCDKLYWTTSTGYGKYKELIEGSHL